MKLCELCSQPFPTKIRLDSKISNLQNRRYCLNCSPYKVHNTRQLSEPWQPDRAVQLSAEAQRKKFRRYQRKKRRQRKQLLLQHMGGCCQICGYNLDCPSAYDFHHCNPADKSFNVCSRGLLRRWEELIAEVRKCVLLCCRCHAEVHAGLHKDRERTWLGQIAQPW